MTSAALNGGTDIEVLVKAINAAKNVRSWLDRVEFIRPMNCEEHFVGWCGVHKKVSITCDFTKAWKVPLRTNIMTYMVESKKTKINVTLDNSIR